MIDIDEIGTLYERPAMPALPTPGAFPVRPTPLDGWHVNTTAPVKGWEALRMTPKTPRVVFGGIATTTHYRFAGRREFLQAARAAGFTALFERGPNKDWLAGQLAAETMLAQALAAQKG